MTTGCKCQIVALHGWLFFLVWGRIETGQFFRSWNPFHFWEFWSSNLMGNMMVFGVPYCQTKPFFVASNEIPMGHSALKTAGGHTECHAGTRAGGSTKWDDTSIPVSNSKIDLMQEWLTPHACFRFFQWKSGSKSRLCSWINLEKLKLSPWLDRFHRFQEFPRSTNPQTYRLENFIEVAPFLIFFFRVPHPQCHC